MDTVVSNFRHIGTHIDRPAPEVYDYASNPANLPEWAAGLGSSVERIDGQWIMESPMGWSAPSSGATAAPVASPRAGVIRPGRGHGLSRARSARSATAKSAGRPVKNSA